MACFKTNISSTYVSVILESLFPSEQNDLVKLFILVINPYSSIALYIGSSQILGGKKSEN